MLDKEKIMIAVQRYADAVAQEFAPAAIVLFGSHAKDLAHEDSDIDVAVIFNGFAGDWMKTSSRLWRLIEGISLDIEPHLLDSAEDKSGFVRHILKTGRIIYSQQAV